MISSSSLACQSESPDETSHGATGDGDASGGQGDTGGDGDTTATGGASATGGAASGGSEAGTGGDTSLPAETESEGCSTGTTLTDGEHTFQLEDKERIYTVRLPSIYDGTTPLPLVLALHPNGSGGGYWDGDAAPRNAREHLDDKAVLIIADAIGGNWRDYGADEATWPDRLEEELSYFDHVFSTAKAGLCLDESAIFSMGFSGGGSFSGVLGCRRSDIRAFAAGGSVVYFDAEDCVNAPPAWIALSEGDATDQRLEFVDHFRAAAGCAETSSTILPDGCIAYDSCEPDSPIVYCNHPGGHELPDYFMVEAWSFFDSVR